MILSLWAVLLFVSYGLAADIQEPSPRERNRTTVDKIYKENLEKYKDNADMLVLPGLVADRKSKSVIVQAEATALRKGEIAEFFLIGDNSDHDYEALAISFAKPSDIHRALEFIGMAAGAPCNEERLQFWPKGERVFMSFASNSNAPVRVEDLVDDDRTVKTLPRSGLVFVGSAKIDSSDQPGTNVYAADVRGPNSIASAYNEAQTVLDIPHHFPQSVVYQHLCVSSRFAFPSNTLIQAILEPEHPDGQKRVVDLLLEVSPKPDTAGVALNDLIFSLNLKEKDKLLNPEPSLKSVLEQISSLAEKGRDPFVALQLHTNLTVKVIHDLAVVLSSIDTEKGIRMEPPLPGHLYYRAFVPDPTFLDRQTRIAQPWELVLSLKDSKLSGVLTQIGQIWKDGVARPDLKTTDYEIPTPEALRQTLDKHGPGLRVILVVAQPDITRGQLMTFLAPALPTHPTIHVFLKE
jgi:hypothetical protein